MSMFAFIIFQIHKNAKLSIEKETSDAENRIKQEQMEEKLSLQAKLLEEEKRRTVQDSMITAMSSDYRSVYYVDLDVALASAEQANKAKTAFLSNMSHEIRTPMNAIIGLDNIALNDPDTPAKTKEYLEKIGTSAEHLLNLINDILDMSRIESGRMVLKNEEFSFSRLIESINTMFSGQCLWAQSFRMRPVPSGQDRWMRSLIIRT